MTNLIYILGLTLLATFIAAQSDEDSPHSCEKICCGGKEYNRNRTTSCCGNEVYDITVFGCCEEQIVDLPNQYDVSYGCCTNEQEGTVASYNTNKEVCCEGQLITKPDCEKYYECCGGQLMDYSEEICCNEEIFPKDNTKYTVCIGNEVKELDEGTEVCGDEIMNSKENTCCQTWIYEEDTKKSIPFGKVHPKTDEEYQTCCGIETYDYNTEICCYHPDGGQYNYVLAKPEELPTDSYQECCGNDIITNYTTQGCCYDTVYNKEESECCGKKLYAISEVEDDKFCCWHTGDYYDFQTQKCTRKGLTDISTTSSKGEESEEEVEGLDTEEGSCISSPYEQYSCQSQCFPSKRVVQYK